MEAKRAVALLSGGIDSSTALAIAAKADYETFALTVRYGQRHTVEIESAKNVATSLGVREHLVLDCDLRSIGGSALTANIAVPKDRTGSEIPVTYVPARNTIFLSFALGWAEVLEAPEIFIGANAVDYSGYPDCRPEYLKAYEDMANLATRASVEGRLRFHIVAPLLEMSKAEIIRAGTELGLNYGLTWSCYDPTSEDSPCLQCDSCCHRAKGFEEAGIKDPLLD